MCKGRLQTSCNIGYRQFLMEWRLKVLISDVYSMSDRSALLGYYYVNFRWPSVLHINAYSCEMCRQSADLVRLWCFVQSGLFGGLHLYFGQYLNCRFSWTLESLKPVFPKLFYSWTPIGFGKYHGSPHP
jgi:hypothetical protein